MKNSQYYKIANDEITPTEQLKRKTKNRIDQNKNKQKRVIIKFANVALAFVFVLSVLWLADENSNKTLNNVEKYTITNQKTSNIKTVDNIDTLKTLLKQNISSKNMLGVEYILETDTVVNSEMQATISKDYSTTNIQVENVDEADVVKTDGQYIYYVADEKAYIIQANNLEIISEIDYSQEDVLPYQIFLNNNILVVIGNQYNYGIVESRDIQSIGKTKAMVYDVTNKQEIKKVREVALEGNLVSARMIQDTVYLIANKSIYIPYNTKIDELDENQLVPYYEDTAITEEKQVIALKDIEYFPGLVDVNSYLTLGSFNITNNAQANIKTILGGGNNVYCSTDNLYIAKTKYNNISLLDQTKSAIGIINDDTANTQSTEIYKFALNNGDIEYINSGSVPGYIINQFSMDEHEGYFRIATTNQSNWNADTSTNQLYVLNEGLNIIGKIENLAKGEKIYSVRFMGDKAYVVTFKQTDPLFVIDVSKPMAPTVLGELKIPGYSQYLHPYDETHLIGFGYNTETTDYGYGEVVINTGIKMALFDVTDVTNPKELFKVDIGEKGTYSKLLNDHKALLFSKEKNIIAFPIEIAEDLRNRYKITFQGAIVYGIDLEKGFTEKSRISSKDTTTESIDYTYAIERIIYIDNNLYTLSQKLIKKIDINTMEQISRYRIN